MQVSVKAPPTTALRNTNGGGSGDTTNTDSAASTSASQGNGSGGCGEVNDATVRRNELVWLMYKLVALFLDTNNSNNNNNSNNVLFRPLPAIQILFECMSANDAKQKVQFISLMHNFLAK